jgi:hypothetical protein
MQAGHTAQALLSEDHQHEFTVSLRQASMHMHTLHKTVHFTEVATPPAADEAQTNHTNAAGWLPSKQLRPACKVQKH